MREAMMLGTGRMLAVHAAFIAVVFAGGLIIGASFMPGEWYAALQKPWLTPAPWVFGPVWTVLYVLIGWAGARTFLRGSPAPGLGGGDGRARALWLGQMGLNWLWSPMFFGLNLPTAALVVILAMLAVILAFIAHQWARDRTAAVLFLPYAVWVSLASAVNAGVVWLN